MGRRYVIVAADFVKTGGMDRANYALASYLARAGHETHLVSFRVDPALAAEPNVRVHIAPRPAGKQTLGGPFLGSLAIAQSLAAGSGAQLIANGGNCPVPGAVNWVHWVAAAYARVHGKLRVRGLIAQATERVALRGARVVIANSERTKEHLVEYLGIDEARIRVIYYGIDPSIFRPRTPAERAEIRAGLGWPADRPKAVFVGALADERKGLETLYSTWGKLCRAPDWDADLVVVGAGRLLERWRARVKADGLGDRVAFLGFRSDVPSIVGASDVLVAPSLYEAYGLAVHEALCSGIPAITPTESGVAEVYPDELSGWLLPDPRDEVDLANRIQRWRASWPAGIPQFRTLSERLRARDWDVAAREIVAACEAP